MASRAMMIRSLSYRPPRALTLTSFQGEQPAESSRSPSLRPPSRHVDSEDLEDADSDAASDFNTFLRKGRIDVGQTWDDSSDEDDHQQTLHRDRTLPLSATGSSAPRDARRRPRRSRSGSILHSFRPTREHRRAWWKFLTNPGAPASLSATHVSANLFSASLHPAVLLSMPHFFARTGVSIGTVALVGVAILGGVGGGLWVVLSRYVNGSSIEAIVGASFGRYTPWKGGLGRVVSGLLLAAYATGSAIIGYFALANLLLQVFFNYAPRGIPLHDRGFITLVVGGIISSPLVIFPLAKRNLIRLNTFFSLLFYPIVVTIILVEIYTPPRLPVQRERPATRARQGASILRQDVGHGRHKPMAQHQPSRPAVHLGAHLTPTPLNPQRLPPQILAHQRSLRRIGTSRSNVKAFLAAQAGQVTFIVVMGILFGVVAGVNGVQGRLHQDVHPNLFASLPTDDHWINVARVLFIAILVTHMAICLTTARSSWGRLLRLMNINPFRRRRAPIQLATNADSTAEVAPSAGDHAQDGRFAKLKRTWGKPARNALAGVILWSITASSAYLSGVGGFRRREREGEEARFTRASEVLGLMGAAVGFVMPGLVWLIAFHIRRPRAILPPFASGISKAASAYFSGPLSMLARNRLFGSRAATASEAEQPLLADQSTDSIAPNAASSHSVHSSRHSQSASLDQGVSIPSHLTEQAAQIGTRQRRFCSRARRGSCRERRGAGGSGRTWWCLQGCCRSGLRCWCWARSS